MMNSICFISNKRSSLEARLFACAIARMPELLSYRLVTTCSTDLELSVFRAWMSRERTADLVLPLNWNRKPDESQEQILQQVKNSGGRLIHPVESDEDIEPRIMKMMRLASIAMVLEIRNDHWLLNWRHQLFATVRSAAFQWAVSTELNAGGLTLLESGRIFPIYPKSWNLDFPKFLAGEMESGKGLPRQLRLL